MKKTAADQLNRLGAQLKQAQAPGDIAWRALNNGLLGTTPADAQRYVPEPEPMHTADNDIIDEFANPHQGPARKPSYIPPKSPSLLSQLGGEAAWAGESPVGRGAALGAAAGAGFNALRTAVGNIRRKKKGEPTKSVLGGALTGGLVGGGLGAGAGYAMKQAEAVDQLNRLGAHLRSPTT